MLMQILYGKFFHWLMFTVKSTIDMPYLVFQYVIFAILNS